MDGEKRYRFGMAASPTSEWIEQTLGALKRNGRARRAVIELLGRQSCCLSAQEIFDQLRAEDHRIGIASVYRSLDKLARDGYVQRVEIGLDGARFEPILPSGEHHHHIVCDDCGRIEAFEDPGLERAIGRLERRTGFTIKGHEVVLHGACNVCAPARNS
jgi:Fur family transcriptional regulator, ferric uptake regulator